MQGSVFNAADYQPDQGGGGHPVGKFPARISATAIKPTKEQDGHYFQIEYTTPSGKINQNFNLWNDSLVAVDIAHKQLSAVCFATGIHRPDMANNGAELIGGSCQIDVRQQKNNPAYVEVGYVYGPDGRDPRDIARGGPATAPAATQPPAAQPQPPAAAPAPWTTAAAPAAQPVPQPPASAQPAPAANWTPGNAPGARPPWAT